MPRHFRVPDHLPWNAFDKFGQHDCEVEEEIGPDEEVDRPVCFPRMTRSKELHVLQQDRQLRDENERDIVDSEDVGQLHFFFSSVNLS